MTEALKTRETRLRRMAERQGLKLVKSRARDPRATTFNTFMLVNAETNTVERGMPSGYGLAADDVESVLSGWVVRTYEDVSVIVQPRDHDRSYNLDPGYRHRFDVWVSAFGKGWLMFTSLQVDDDHSFGDASMSEEEAACYAAEHYRYLLTVQPEA